jgi:hypothetical protein
MIATRSAAWIAAGVAGLAVSACTQAPPPEHAGNTFRPYYGEVRTTLEVVVDPPDARCIMQLPSGQKLVPATTPRLVTLLVKNESPATITCEKDGFTTVARTITSESKMNAAAFYPLVFLLAGGAAAADAATNGVNLRFQPMVAIVLKPAHVDGDEADWRAAKRAFVAEHWNAYVAEQLALCHQSSRDRDCRENADLKAYIDADLATL